MSLCSTRCQRSKPFIRYPLCFRCYFSSGFTQINRTARFRSLVQRFYVLRTLLVLAVYWMTSRVNLDDAFGQRAAQRRTLVDTRHQATLRSKQYHPRRYAIRLDVRFAWNSATRQICFASVSKLLSIPEEGWALVCCRLSSLRKSPVREMTAREWSIADHCLEKQNLFGSERICTIIKNNILKGRNGTLKSGIIAHRGACGYLPEHTLQGVELL